MDSSGPRPTAPGSMETLGRQSQTGPSMPFMEAGVPEFQLVRIVCLLKRGFADGTWAVVVSFEPIPERNVHGPLPTKCSFPSDGDPQL
jgi:hypothetical protein